MFLTQLFNCHCPKERDVICLPCLYRGACWVCWGFCRRNCFVTSLNITGNLFDELLRLVSVTAEDDVLCKMTLLCSRVWTELSARHTSPSSYFLPMFLKSPLRWSMLWILPFPSALFFLHLYILHLSWPSFCCNLAWHHQEEFWAVLMLLRLAG